MGQQEIIEKLIKIEQQSTSNASAIAEIKEEVKQNRELTIAVKEIATEMKHLREDQQDMNNRLKKIEEKPAKNWEAIIKTILTTVVSVLVGAGLALLLK